MIQPHSDPQPSAPLQIPLLLVLFIAAICAWGGLGNHGVLNDNEGLYAEVAREMLVSGDWHQWVIPHLNGLLYMEKPPLLYWLTALVFSIFGQADYAVRLVPSTSALACVGVMLYLGKRINRPMAGRLASIIFISGVGIMLMSHTLMFDMLLTACLTAAIVFAYLFERDGRYRDLRIAAACLALALLAKGLLSVALFGLTIGLWQMLKYRLSVFGQMARWLDGRAFMVFLLLAVPWHIAATLVEPSFAWFYFINEHVHRFLGHRIPDEYYKGPWWYYLPRLVIFLFPWSFLVPALLLSKPQKEHDDSIVDLKKLLTLGWVIALLFFSLSSAKANYYMVVVMPFAAFHLALVLESHRYLTGKLSLGAGVLVALMAATAALILQFSHNNSTLTLTLMGMPWRQFAVAALILAVVLSLACALVAWLKPKLGIVVYAILPIYILVILVNVVTAMEVFVTDAPIASFIQQTMPDRTVYMYRLFEQNSSLPFYLKKPVLIVESRSNDLYWGNKLEPANTLIISQEQFLAQKPPMVVVVTDSYLDEFIANHLQLRFTSSRRFGKNTVFY